MKVEKPDIQLPVRLNLDHDPERQPDGTYRFALNALNDSSDGSFGTLVNEPGNELCAELPGNELGSISISPTRKIIFTDDNSISLFDSSTCELTSLVQLDDFAFSGPIQGRARLVRGCENVVYWCDHINPDRFFNIDRPEKFKTNGSFDVSLFNIQYPATHPKITTQVFEQGGSLELGNYFFVVEYVDDFGNVLFTSLPTINPVSIPGTDGEGGLNIDTSLPEVGGKPKSSYSIEVTINNIPSNIEQVRLNVIYSISDDLTTIGAYRKSTLYSVSQQSTKILYTGFNPDSGDTIVDPFSLLAPRVIYSSSRVMEQVQGRLIRHNLKETVRDYSEFQVTASKICMKYVTKDVDKSEAHLYKSELGGEVVPKAIVYVFSDGTVSDAYHIPAPQIADTSVIISTKQCIQIEVTQGSQPNCPGPAQYYIVWSVNGTEHTEYGETEDDIAIACYDESDDVEITFFQYDPYPQYDYGEDVDCNRTLTASVEIVDSYTEQDSLYLPETSIDETPEPGFSSSGTLGTYLTEQTYENPPNFCGTDYWGTDCDGNSLLGTNVRLPIIPDRSSEPLITEDDKIRIIGIQYSNIEYPHPEIVGHYFVTARRTENNSLVLAKGLLFPHEHGTDADGRYFNTVAGDTPQANFYDGGFLYSFVTNEYLFDFFIPRGNRIIQEGYFDFFTSEAGRTFESYFDSDLPYDDLVVFEKYHRLTDYIARSDRPNYTIQENISLRPRTEFDGIENRSHSNSMQIVSIDRSDYENVVQYVSMKNSIAPFPDIWQIEYRLSSELSANTTFTGDAFISKLSMTNISWIDVNGNGFFDLVFDEFFGFGGGTTEVKVEAEKINDIYLESIVNPYYRHSGTELCNDFHDNQGLTEFIADRVTEELQNGNYKLRDSICPEWYGYNKSYSKINDFRTFRTIGYLYDFCSDCNGIYPTTFTWSEKSFLNDRADNYRVYLANNIRTIESGKGEIIGSDYKDNKLVIRTTESCFFLQPNPQQLQTTESTVYLGTGDFLSLPEAEINVTEIGWGGQQHVHESANTPFGLIWIDRTRKAVLKLGGTIEKLNTHGLFHWSFNNLSGDDTCVIGYDPKFERILITKKNSFTISYNFFLKDSSGNGWVSWHSYIPGWYLSAPDTFFSVHDQKIWKHGIEDKYCEFYGIEFPYVIEFITKQMSSAHPVSAQWYGKAFINDVESRDTFDQILVYNDTQSTGLLNLRLNSNGMDNIFYDPTTVIAEITDKLTKVSNLWDNATDSDVFSDDISDYQVDGQGYIDKVPENVDINTAQVKKGYFNDGYIAVRLFLNNTAIRMHVNLLMTYKWLNNR